MLILVYFLTASFIHAQPFNPKDGAVVKIDGYTITQGDVFNLFAQRYSNETNEVIRELIVRHMVKKTVQKERIIISKKDIIKSANAQLRQFKKQIKEQLKLSWEEYLRTKGTKEKKIKNQILVDSKYKLALQQVIKLSHLRQKRIRARHIMVANQKNADIILQKLKRGADFATLARQNSSDRITRDEGGMFPLIFRGDLPPELEKAIWELSPGSLQIIKSPMGLHIMEILDVYQGAPSASWKSLRAELKTSLAKDPVSPIDLRRWLNKNRKLFKITQLWKN